MDFMKNLNVASFTRTTRKCAKKTCRECPWRFSCQPFSEPFENAAEPIVAETPSCTETVSESHTSSDRTVQRTCAAAEAAFITAEDPQETGLSAGKEPSAAETAQAQTEVVEKMPHKLFPEAETRPPRTETENQNFLQNSQGSLPGNHCSSESQTDQTLSLEGENRPLFRPAGSPCSPNLCGACPKPPHAFPSHACPPQTCPPTGDCCDREQNICEILRSIARVENSLACILDAEGAKLQKAIEKACTVEELLKINQSVQITLARAAALEQALYLKLETIHK